MLFLASFLDFVYDVWHPFGSIFDDSQCFRRHFFEYAFFTDCHKFWDGFREGEPCFFANGPSRIVVFCN